MALSNDEKEVVRELDDSGHTDFYAPVLAIAMLRFHALIRGRGADIVPIRPIATEDVVKLVRGVYDDIEADSLERDSGT